MKKTLNKIFFIVPAVCVLAFVCIMFARGLGQVQSNDSAPDDSVTTTVISKLLVNMTGEDLYEHSTLVIRGKVVDQSDPFQIAPVTGGDPSNFTDYYVEIYETLRGGSAEVGDVVSVRIEGGLVNNLSVICHETAELHIDDEVLLYLYRSGMGAGYNTEGDHYYIVGEKQGAFILNEPTQKTFSNNASEIFVSKDEEEVVYHEAAEQIEEYTEKNPVNEDIFYDEFLNNLKLNLESGFISQDEYNRLLAEAQVYATIVD